MNAAMVGQIRGRAAQIMCTPGLQVTPPVVLDRVQEMVHAFAVEMYLQGGIDALQDEVLRVRADTAAKIAAAEHEENKS